MAASILFAVYLLICKVLNIDDNGIEIVGLLGGFIVAIVTPVYYHALMKLLELDFGKIFDFFVDQTVVFLIEDFLAFMYYAYTSDDNRTFYHDNTPVHKCVLYLFMYLIGIGVYFIWCDKRKRKIDGGSEEEKGSSIDKGMNKDEYGIGKVSSEIILIPGIDKDSNEDKKDSASAGNSRDT